MNQLKRFLNEEDGLSTVEIILILIFKDEMISIVESIFKTITDKVKKVD